MDDIRIRARRAGAVALLAASALTLAACSNSGSSASPTPTATAPSPKPTATADPALAAKVPATIKKSGTLAFGTDPTYAPAEFYAAKGKAVQGYDIDLGNAVAATLGLKATWDDATAATLTSGVEGGDYDAVMSSVTITAGVLEDANAVSYFSAGTSWAVAQGNPQNFATDDVCGKTIAVQKGHGQAEAALTALKSACKKAKAPALVIAPFALQTEVTNAVTTNKAAALIAESPAAEYMIAQSTGQLEAIGDVSNTQPQGIIVAKDATALATVIQSAVQQLIDNGIYQQILDAWKVSVGEITQSQLNPEPAASESS